jgi:HAD superfamily hydrolase (TIGR01509 family)
MIEAVLFDMDGVLTDTEEFICKAAMSMFKEKGVEVKPEDFLPFVGAGENRYIGGVAEKYEIHLDIQEAKRRTYEIYEEITRGQLEPLPGAVSFIHKCRDKGLKMAVATSADKIKMEINLRETGIPVELFHATVNGLEVTHKKPDPEIFITAAKKIHIPVKKCLVVEDAVNGVKAAKRAGAKCLGLKTSFSSHELIEADWISNNLEDAPEACINW